MILVCKMTTLVTVLDAIRYDPILLNQKITKRYRFVSLVLLLVLPFKALNGLHNVLQQHKALPLH